MLTDGYGFLCYKRFGLLCYSGHLKSVYKALPENGRGSLGMGRHRIMDWNGITVRIEWTRSSRRRWPPSAKLARPFAPWRKERNVLFYWWAGRARRHLRPPIGWVPIHAGLCHWARPGWAYDVIQSARNPLGTTSIHFDLLDSAGRVIPPDPARLPPEQLTVRAPHLVEAVTRWIADLALDRRAGATLRPDLESAACDLLRGLLIMLDRDTSGAASAAPTGEPDVWRNLTAHIQEHLHDLGGVSELVERSGYTRSHFSRLFRQQTGLSPQDYIINARIALAKELLRETSMSVSQVATRTGYGDIFRFSRQFKKRTGLTPSDYRLQRTEVL